MRLSHVGLYLSGFTGCFQGSVSGGNVADLSKKGICDIAKKKFLNWVIIYVQIVIIAFCDETLKFCILYSYFCQYYLCVSVFGMKRCFISNPYYSYSVWRYVENRALANILAILFCYTLIVSVILHLQTFPTRIELSPFFPLVCMAAIKFKMADLYRDRKINLLQSS